MRDGPVTIPSFVHVSVFFSVGFNVENFDLYEQRVRLTVWDVGGQGMLLSYFCCCCYYCCCRCCCCC